MASVLPGLAVLADVSFAVDEELWFGERADVESEKLAAQSMAARAGRILGAKPFPLAARKLAELTRDPDVPLKDLVTVLESDSALSARLLRLVNSAGYALRVRCTSVRHAAALVGIEKLHQVSTTAAILDLFDSQTAHAARILEHGTIVAALSRYLAAHLSLPTDDLFTAGFLHDIGKLMLLETEGENYVDLLNEHGEEFDCLHRAERERFGFDHAVLGAHVLAAWNIPQPIPRLVAWHHQLGRAYEAGTRWCSLVCTLRLADQLSYSLDVEDAAREIERLASGEAARFLEISEPQLDAMWHELRVLMLRSRAVFRGEEPPALDPLPVRRSGPFKKPDSAPPPLLEPQVPKSFPCVVCDGPSFGNRCQACGGHVCPAHELAPDSWCSLCVQDWAAHVSASQPKLSTKLGLSLGTLALAVLAGYGASLGQTANGLSVGVGSVLAMTFAWTVTLVASRWWRRTSFLRQRPNREQPEARRVTPEAEPQRVTPEFSAALESSACQLLESAPEAALEGAGATEDDGPTVIFAPSSEDFHPEARLSSPSPTISFAPVEDDLAMGLDGYSMPIPSFGPDADLDLYAESAGASSNVTLSTPNLRAPRFPSLPPISPDFADLPSSLTLGDTLRLSVAPKRPAQHENCEASPSLESSCFRKALEVCCTNESSCSSLPEEQAWTAWLEPDLAVQSRPSPSHVDLRHAC